MERMRAINQITNWEAMAEGLLESIAAGKGYDDEIAKDVLIFFPNKTSDLWILLNDFVRANSKDRKSS